VPKCVCGLGSAPDPAGGAYSTPPDTLVGFKGPTSEEKGKEGGGRGGEKGEGKGKGRERVIPILRELCAFDGACATSVRQANYRQLSLRRLLLLAATVARVTVTQPRRSLIMTVHRE